LVRKPGGFFHDAHRNLELSDDGVAPGELGLDGLDARRGEQVIGRAGYSDEILAGFSAQENQRNATRDAFVRLEVADVDFLAPKARCSEGAKIIVSASPNEDDACAGAGRSHGLIGSLSSSGALELAAEKGFSGLWKAIADDDEVCI
jgi:hypothetical protein